MFLGLGAMALFGCGNDSKSPENSPSDSYLQLNSDNAPANRRIGF